MNLNELSVQYRAEAAKLEKRIHQLKRLEARAEDPEERRGYQARIRALSSMWRDTHDIAYITEHYYERGFRRNAKYVI